MKKKMFGILILLLVFYTAGAQQSRYGSGSQWTVAIGAGAANTTVADKKFSASGFNGTTILGDASVGYQRNKVTHQLHFSYNAGKLQTRNNENSLQHHYLTAEYFNLYQLGNSEERAVVFNVGPSFNVMYASRYFDGFVNNKTSFDFAASISAAVSVRCLIGDPASGFSITDQVFVPVIAAIVQPSFGSENVSGNLTKSGFSAGDIFSDGKIQSFKSFFRIKNVLAVEKKLGADNNIVLKYSWDYYHLDGIRNVVQAQHTIHLSYCFIF